MLLVEGGACNLANKVGVLASVADHLGEESFLLLEELVRRTSLNDSTPAHDDDLVVVGDGVETVGDGDDGGVGELGVDAVLDELVGGHVHVRRGFVQDQELVAPQQCACQTQQLLLSH